MHAEIRQNEKITNSKPEIIMRITWFIFILPIVFACSNHKKQANILPGGIAANNVVISNNMISNWAAHAINILGEGWLVENNYFTDLKSFRAIGFAGNNQIIRRKD